MKISIYCLQLGALLPLGDELLLTFRVEIYNVSRKHSIVVKSCKYMQQG